MQKLSLKEKYLKEVKPKLAKEFGIKNPYAVGEIKKIIVNVGIGQLSKEKAKLDQLKTDIAQITGQAPSVRAAKLSVAGFNIRAGMPVGLKVTLRGTRMYAFLGRLISVVLPRLRDFRGVPRKGFDEHGNYTLGIVEHSVFPEIDISKSGSFGMEVTIVTSSGNKERALKLLELMGMPFEKSEEYLDSAQGKQGVKGK